MPRNTSVTLGEHFSAFVNTIIRRGRFESTSEAVRAGLRLLEAEETKLQILRETLANGEAQLKAGQGADGEEFVQSLLNH